MHSYKTNQRPSISAVDKFFDPEDFRDVVDYAYNSSYTYGESDETYLPPTGLTHEILKEELSCEEEEILELFDSKIKDKFPEIENYQLYRAYINCFSPRELAFFHQDCNEDRDDITFLFYANKIYKGLDNGGTTEFYLEDKIIAIPPVPNTLVKFTGWIWHRATPLMQDHRFTYAFKYRKEDY